LKSYKNKILILGVQDYQNVTKNDAIILSLPKMKQSMIIKGKLKSNETEEQ
jgi:hypothetical protein